MSRIADDQRGSRQTSESDERLAERRAALRRAVSDLGDVTSRFRNRLEDSGHELPPPPARNGNGTSAPLARARRRPPARPFAALAGPAADSAEPDEDPGSEAIAYRDAALADARKRFESASRQADALVRTITEAVQSETRAVHADVEATAEARCREIETEAQRRLRRAEPRPTPSSSSGAAGSPRSATASSSSARRSPAASRRPTRLTASSTSSSRPQPGLRPARPRALPAQPAAANGAVAELSVHDRDQQSSGLAEAA